MRISVPTPDAALAFVLRHWLVAALLIALIIQTVRIEGFKIWPLSIAGLKAELADAKAKVAANVQAAKQQRQTTTRTITIYRDRVKSGVRAAERVEQAPTEPNCRTPDAVMGADL